MIPEKEAADRIAKAISKYHDAKRWYTDEFWSQVAAKIVAHRGFITSVFRDLDADPHTIGANDGIKLRQQPVNQLDSLEFFLEEYAYHQKAMNEAGDMIDRIRAQRLAEHEPDERAADEDDARVSQERRDFAATDAAPRWQDAS